MDYVLRAATSNIKRSYFHHGTLGACYYCWWGRYDMGSPYYGAYAAAAAMAGGVYISALDAGTTDYAVEIFHEALDERSYNCFLKEDTYLPMMYMPDAIRATIQLMEAPADKLSVRTSYNVSALSFSPREIAAEIKKHIPDFSIQYAPDYRQKIADSWPRSIDDSVAREDWNWAPEYDLARMTADMFENLG